MVTGRPISHSTETSAHLPQIDGIGRLVFAPFARTVLKVGPYIVVNTRAPQLVTAIATVIGVVAQVVPTDAVAIEALEAVSVALVALVCAATGHLNVGHCHVRARFGVWGSVGGLEDQSEAGAHPTDQSLSQSPLFLDHSERVAVPDLGLLVAILVDEHSEV